MYERMVMVAGFGSTAAGTLVGLLAAMATGMTDQALAFSAAGGVVGSGLGWAVARDRFHGGTSRA